MDPGESEYLSGYRVDVLDANKVKVGSCEGAKADMEDIEQDTVSCNNVRLDLNLLFYLNDLSSASY